MIALAAWRRVERGADAGRCHLPTIETRGVSTFAILHAVLSLLVYSIPEVTRDETHFALALVVP